MDNINMTTLRRLLCVALLFTISTVFAVFPVPISAHPDEGEFYFAPTNYTFDTNMKDVGDTFQAEIYCQDLEDLYAWQVMVSFNATLLNVQTTDFLPDELLHQGTHMKAGPTIDNTEGTVLFGVTSLETFGVDTIPETGLCSITFEIMAPPPTMGYVESNITLVTTGARRCKWETWDPARTVYPDVTDGYYKYFSAITISVISPENRTYTTSLVPLTFTLDRPASWMGYSLDGQADVPVTGNTTLTDLPEGPHSITVYANDTAGNMGSSDTVYFTIDTIPPEILILSPENKTTYIGDSVPDGLVFTITGPVSWMGYSLDGQADVPVTGNTTLTDLPEGPHSITVYANDTAGNMGSSDTVYFTMLVSLQDVAVYSIVPSSTEVFKGEHVDILVKVGNKGTESETFNVTVYYDMEVIGTQTVINLNPDDFLHLAFVWDTTEVTTGNYTLNATAGPLSNETDVDDNTRTCDIEVTSPEIEIGPPPWGSVVAIGMAIAVIGFAVAIMIRFVEKEETSRPSKETFKTFSTLLPS